MSVIHPTQSAILAAGSALREGKVVVIPTETVYGLACDARNPDAVQAIFDIKLRPNENPLIVHVDSIEQAKQLTLPWPKVADQLAEAFWPGPLTLVLRKNDKIPAITTGGLDTVAIRMPRHPIAQAVIRAAGCPVAAPSANIFMGLSPTNADDIDPQILVDVDIILDGGQCEVGIESTVVDVTGENPKILRPGNVTSADIQALIGRPLGAIPPDQARRSPGLYKRHYSPRAKVVLCDECPSDEAALVLRAKQGERHVKMPNDAIAYGASLYSAMRRLDLEGHEVIYVEKPPTTAPWEAVNDRLLKSAGLG